MINLFTIIENKLLRNLFLTFNSVVVHVPLRKDRTAREKDKTGTKFFQPLHLSSIKPET